MKTFIVTFFAFALSSSVFAQDQKQDWQNKDIIIMKDQKVVVIKAGEKSVLMQDTTLANGTVVMVNGTVKSTDGSSVVLKDGEYVKADGTIGKKAWKEEKKDPMQKDSTIIQ